MDIFGDKDWQQLTIIQTRAFRGIAKYHPSSTIHLHVHTHTQRDHNSLSQQDTLNNTFNMLTFFTKIPIVYIMCCQTLMLIPREYTVDLQWLCMYVINVSYYIPCLEIDCDIR